MLNRVNFGVKWFISRFVQYDKHFWKTGWFEDFCLRGYNAHIVMRRRALRAGCPLPPGRFLVLISVRGWVDPRAIARLDGLCKLKKKSSDLIGNQTRDLPACSIIVLQLTTVLRQLIKNIAHSAITILKKRPSLRLILSQINPIHNTPCKQSEDTKCQYNVTRLRRS
jgi:hypothetical protein